MDSERRRALDWVSATKILIEDRPIRVALDILQEVIVHSDKNHISVASLTYLRHKTRELLTLVGGDTNAKS